MTPISIHLRLHPAVFLLPLPLGGCEANVTHPHFTGEKVAGRGSPKAGEHRGQVAEAGPPDPPSAGKSLDGEKGLVLTEPA